MCVCACVPRYQLKSCANCEVQQTYIPTTAANHKFIVRRCRAIECFLVRGLVRGLGKLSPSLSQSFPSPRISADPPCLVRRGDDAHARTHTCTAVHVEIASPSGQAHCNLWQRDSASLVLVARKTTNGPFRTNSSISVNRFWPLSSLRLAKAMHCRSKLPCSHHIFVAPTLFRCQIVSPSEASYVSGGFPIGRSKPGLTCGCLPCLQHAMAP